MSTSDNLIFQSFTNTRKKIEFLRSRWLLSQFLSHEEKIAKHPEGYIIWPDHTIGSLSHKKEVITCCVLKHSSLKGIGVDIELLENINLKIINHICNENEIKLIDGICEGANNCYLSKEELLILFFSFKESIYKSIFPYGKIKFYFHDAEIIDVDFAKKTITAHLMKNVSPLHQQGDVVLGQFSKITVDSKNYLLSGSFWG